MSSSRDLHDDDDLVGALGDAFADDLADVPPQVSRFARDAFEWTAIDGELARLAADSAERSVELARGSRDERFLTFETPTRSVELELRSGLVVGWIQPEGPYEVDFVTPAGVMTRLQSDPIGRFRAELSTPFRLTVRDAAGALTTEWITV
jgi:hypothetical protein